MTAPLINSCFPKSDAAECFAAVGSIVSLTVLVIGIMGTLAASFTPAAGWAMMGGGGIWFFAEVGWCCFKNKDESHPQVIKDSVKDAVGDVGGLPQKPQRGSDESLNLSFGSLGEEGRGPGNSVSEKPQISIECCRNSITAWDQFLLGRFLEPLEGEKICVFVQHHDIEQEQEYAQQKHEDIQKKNQLYSFVVKHERKRGDQDC